MSDILGRLTTLFRGRVRLADLPREALRRRRVSRHQRSERLLGDISRPARLAHAMAGLTPEALKIHFRERPRYFFAPEAGALSAELFPEDTSGTIASAQRIVDESTWEIAGFGAARFDGENYWRRDPLGDKDWGTAYHADVETRDRTADIRVLWEANRLGQVIDLARAFAVTEDERFADRFFSQIEDWSRQNPYGRGANWVSAMEVALRAINVLSAFDILREAESCTEERVMRMLEFFDQHGRFIFENSEFSYISTSNHYLSNVVGLFWIGTCLPELEQAAEWRTFSLAEIEGETTKQVNADGSHFEASTGYHKFVTEILLYTLHLAKVNSVGVPATLRTTVEAMLEYLWAVKRPDGRIPLIGDADGSRIVPIGIRDTADAEYLVRLGAVVTGDAKLTAAKEYPETLWLAGTKGLEAFESPPPSEPLHSVDVFPDAGACILRGGGLYVHLNANDAGLNGRGSHAHNDALSIEVAAHGVAFIVDPGSYVYNLDLDERHRFRSNAYHSTLEIDGVEQNTTDAATPFIIGNEAKPRIVSSGERIVAEHYGYRRLKQPVTHRRSVRFLDSGNGWEIEDSLTGSGEHELCFRFHFDHGLEISCDDAGVEAVDPKTGTWVMVTLLDADAMLSLEPNFVSRTYGEKLSSMSACWRITAEVPSRFRWIVSVTKGGAGLNCLSCPRSLLVKP